MNEGTIVTGLLKNLRGQFRGGLVVKHNDIGTKGLPDISVHFANRGSYAEIKYLRTGEKLKDIVEATQVILCHQFATIYDGRSWIVVFEQKPKRVAIWTPKALFSQLWPALSTDRSALTPSDPTDVDLTCNFTRDLAAWGAIRLTGWHYDIVSRLILNYLRQERDR